MIHPRIKEIKKDLEEALDACDLRKNFGLSEREVRKIVDSASDIPHVCSAVIDMLDNPNKHWICNAYNDVINGVLFELAEKLVKD